MEGLADFPDNMKSLNDCCYNKTCLGGFQSLPDRLVNFHVTEPVALLSSKSKYCQECGFPEQEKVTDGDLDDYMDEHANLAMGSGFESMFPHHTPKVFRCVFTTRYLTGCLGI